jgi:DNA-binding transcriptional LysR family regulator
MRKDLEYIIKVAECGQINKAAKKLYITSSALSKYIITKEKYLGIELFDRSGKRFTLTYAGERYVEWAKKIIALEERMTFELENISNENKGRMKFGFQLMQSQIIFSKIIPIFKKNYPNVNIILETTHTSELMQMLRDDQLDFIISTHSKKIDGYVYIPLKKIRIALIVPKNHSIVKTAISKEGHKYPWVDIKKLEDEMFVSLRKKQEPRIIMDSVFNEENINPQISMEVHTTELTILSVSNNFGLTIGYDLPCNYDMYKNHVELLSFGQHSQVIRDLSIIYKETYLSKKFSSDFMNIAKEAFRTLTGE